LQLIYASTFQDSFMKNLLGVMQGRLLPKYEGRYQAHPKGYWQDEFKIAKNLGLDCIEFILDFNDFNDNPLMHKEGVDEILSISNFHGVSVKSICADYFMEAPLHHYDEVEVEKSIKVLEQLIESSSLLGVKDIVIPCVDNSSLVGSHNANRFIENISGQIKNIEKRNINIALETDLPPRDFVNLLENINSNNVTINYDIGNSASLGFDPVEELECYGDRITDIHIKDRTLNGGPVVLGSGNANFDIFFEKLIGLDYNGIFIMQAYRDDNGVEIFKEQMHWFVNNYG
jgi:L-ribulose-5-phosphate 3-epimerase